MSVYQSTRGDALTTGEAAKLLRVSQHAVILWIDKGYLRGYRLPGGRRVRRVLRSELERFARENGIPLAEGSPTAGE